MKHDGHTRLLREGPDRIKCHVARRVAGWTARSHEQRGGTGLERFGRHRASTLEVCQRDVAGGQQPRVDRTEIQHAPVVGPGHAVSEIEISRVLPVMQPSVVEGVEDELTGHADQIDGA